MGSHSNHSGHPFVLINGFHTQTLVPGAQNSVFRDPVALALDSIYSIGSGAGEDPNLKAQINHVNKQFNHQQSDHHLQPLSSGHSGPRNKKSNRGQNPQTSGSSDHRNNNNTQQQIQNMPLAMQIAFPSQMIDAHHPSNHLLFATQQPQMIQQQQQQQQQQSSSQNQHQPTQGTSGRGKKDHQNNNHNAGLIEPECVIEENSSHSSSAMGSNRSSADKFICADCNHSFANQYNYTRHRKTHEAQPAAVSIALVK